MEQRILTKSDDLSFPWIFTQPHVIKSNDLKSKIEFVRNMEWGNNTDFQKVFDLILQVAVRGNLKKEQMIKRVFVFSDMEFDKASANNWETDLML
ncbi:hypothetical protein L484_013168 [Morus notabilis]|uniref:DUF7788 domain-containing protein n=1 Tax=Morus notabilis TaxID=981085 RepID=W9RM80_9ROSA|nr:hypothetical protein L484_013168 [Morus notabilis]